MQPDAAPAMGCMVKLVYTVLRFIYTETAGTAR